MLILFSLSLSLCFFFWRKRTFIKMTKSPTSIFQASLIERGREELLHTKTESRETAHCHRVGYCVQPLNPTRKQLSEESLRFSTLLSTVGMAFFRATTAMDE